MLLVGPCKENLCSILTLSPLYRRIARNVCACAVILYRPHRQGAPGLSPAVGSGVNSCSTRADWGIRVREPWGNLPGVEGRRPDRATVMLYWCRWNGDGAKRESGGAFMWCGGCAFAPAIAAPSLVVLEAHSKMRTASCSTRMLGKGVLNWHGDCYQA